MLNRLENNIAIVNILHEIVNYNPELRFCQILSILNLDMDLFYQESSETYKNIQELTKEHFNI